MADEIVDLRDKATPENAHTVRVKIDARRWIAAKLKPRVYGERPPDLNVTTNVQAVVLTEDKARELQKRLKRPTRSLTRISSPSNGNAFSNETEPKEW